MSGRRFGRLAERAVAERLERAALGLPPLRRHKKLGPPRKGQKPTPWPAAMARREEAFARCQRCGAIRIANEAGKLPPHRCEA